MKVMNYFCVIALLLMTRFSVSALPSSVEAALSNGSIKMYNLIVPNDTATPISRTSPKTGVNPLSSGIYIVRIKDSGNHEGVMKMSKL